MGISNKGLNSNSKNSFLSSLRNLTVANRTKLVSYSCRERITVFFLFSLVSNKNSFIEIILQLS